MSFSEYESLMWIHDSDMSPHFLDFYKPVKSPFK